MTLYSVYLLSLILTTSLCLEVDMRNIADVRIAGGTPAARGEFPHVVGITTKSSRGTFVYCGGALIDQYWVLTAGHCYDKYTASQTAVHIGSIDSQDNTGEGMLINVLQVFVHPLYNNITLENDVALLQLATPVLENNSTIMYMNIEIDPIPVNFWLWGTGWGHVQNGPLQTMLRKVQVPTVPGANCLVHGGFYSDMMICAGLGDGKDTCAGDSGTSLVYKKKSTDTRWTGVGITSFGGAICGGPGVKGTYTKISYHRRWINMQMSPQYILQATPSEKSTTWMNSTPLRFNYSFEMIALAIFFVLNI
jgi:secreted trypsin-like serine protease